MAYQRRNRNTRSARRTTRAPVRRRAATRSAPRRRAAPARRTASRRSAPQTLRIVLEQPAVNSVSRPDLPLTAQPSDAAPKKARF